LAIVWPCPLPVDEYAAAGRDLVFPRPGCPSCAGPMTFWSGYRRWVRDRRGCRRVFVPRLRCGACRVSHALLPAFVLARRLDTAGTIGGVLAAVAAGRCGVRPAAERAGVAHTTARGWWRRFAARAPVLGAGFAALAVELGGEAITPPEGAARFATAAGLPGWAPLGAWRFASAVTGGMMLAANTPAPWLVVGGRRFMPPVPP